MSTQLLEHVAVGSSAPSAILTALRGMPKVHKVEEVPMTDDENGSGQMQTFRLYAEDAGALVVGTSQAVLQTGAELRDLHIARPSLEDVFIYLTGRNLRS